MSNARIILVTLICATPVILLLDGTLMDGLVAGILAMGIAIVGRTMHPREAEFLISFTRPIAVIALVPALSILVQILPLKPFAHPFWSSAEAALGHPIAGSISIDTGASVMALGRYLLLGAVTLLSATVSIDRLRAEWVLFSLTAATGLIGLVLAMHDLFGHTFLSVGAAPYGRAQAIDCCALGLIFSATAGIRTLERYQTRHASPGRSVTHLMRTFAACGAGFAICAMALALGATGGEVAAAIFGLAALAAVMAIRRLGLGTWGTAAIAVTALVVVALLGASEPNLRTNSGSLAFAARAPASLISLSQRMLADAPSTGTGAGTFAAMMPIYRGVDDPETNTAAPTAMSVFALELGGPMSWLAVTATIALIIAMLRASLQRGRDSFYPAAGAACLITLLFLSFMNPGFLGTAVALIAAAALGLALAQSKSRTIQP